MSLHPAAPFLRASTAELAESLWPAGPFVLAVDDRIQDARAQALVEKMTTDSVRAARRSVLIPAHLQHVSRGRSGPRSTP